MRLEWILLCLQLFQDTSSKEADVWLSTSIRVTDLAIAPDFSRVVIIGLEQLPPPMVPKPPSVHESQAASGSSTDITPVRYQNCLVIYDYATRKQEACVFASHAIKLSSCC